MERVTVCGSSDNILKRVFFRFKIRTITIFFDAVHCLKFVRDAIDFIEVMLAPGKEDK